MSKLRSVIVLVLVAAALVGAGVSQILTANIIRDTPVGSSVGESKAAADALLNNSLNIADNVYQQQVIAQWTIKDLLKVVADQDSVLINLAVDGAKRDEALIKTQMLTNWLLAGLLATFGVWATRRTWKSQERKFTNSVFKGDDDTGSPQNAFWNKGSKDVRTELQSSTATSTKNNKFESIKSKFGKPIFLVGVALLTSLAIYFYSVVSSNSFSSLGGSEVQIDEGSEAKALSSLLELECVSPPESFDLKEFPSVERARTTLKIEVSGSDGQKMTYFSMRNGGQAAFFTESRSSWGCPDVLSK